ncbi:MAG: FAD-linked oxidase C-terminal domain-containing protein [Bacteroidota bacterium]|nr:FAD-linked oxidase C-terminal domain-containing protein [Bacteroidota bacterium]
MKEADLIELKNGIEGDVYYDNVMKTLYATDASVYREFPTAVVRPKTVSDIQKTILFAKKHKNSVIPRAAGTSLAGQVVGSGIVVDISKYWTQILEINTTEKWVRVQPGVNLDELNKVLETHGLFFGPETSTSNRCMIGGMVGNNSCGSHSVIYGTTRDHVLELKCILSDGNETTFKSLSQNEFMDKCLGRTSVSDLESSIYQNIKEILTQPEVQKNIIKEFPKPNIKRRNTGYAIDELLDTELFTDKPYLTYKENGIGIQNRQFNFSKLISGSEGTLAFTTEIKLNLVDIPPKVKGALAVHLHSIDEACKATIVALKYHPGAVELLDDIVLKAAEQNIEQKKNMFFIKDLPKAVIIVEWARTTKEEIEKLSNELEAELTDSGFGYHFPRLWGAEIGAAWSLRKAGLGLLANVPGDPKAVACIEDTAVAVEDQPAFAAEFAQIMAKYGKSSVYYAHIGDGELHLRPILDLKKSEDRELFFKITDDVASLVKKYGGSMSGEHGDGRVRGEFVKKMVGESNYQIFIDIKKTWDPDNIFNPGKIVHSPKMNEQLRYANNQETRQFDTVFNFKETEGILRMAEKCNGSGDCRKSSIIGGTMCPSYQATKNEKETTRARANILREFLTTSPKKNAFDHKEIKEVYDLCLSCKGCKSECPSNVDVATMKAEFTQHYYDANGVPFRSFMIGHFVKAMEIASNIPAIYNFLMSNKVTGTIANAVMGIHQKRSFPLLHKTTFLNWYKKNHSAFNTQNLSFKKRVYLFADEFTNFNDVEIGITAVKLLHKLGYEVVVPNHHESGRTFLSKGFVRKAQKLAIKNVQLLKDIVSSETPLLGIEPSCILSFRDEYPSLVPEHLESDAKKLAKNCFLIDEFIASEIDKGSITKEQFTYASKKIKLHGHCHQKALSSVTPTKKILEFPVNYSVEMIPSGCCGMAGSFGYEKEHYEISMQVGELVLFPTVRKAADYEIVAPGTSCRHQIHDGTGRLAKHPVEVIWEALA